MMRAGQLDRRVTLQRRAGVLTVSGQPFDVWNDIATRWASVKPLRGNEQFTDPQLVAKEIVEVQIRFTAATADLHPGDRIVYPTGLASMPNAVYNILAVHEIGRREGQKIIAERLPIPDSGVPDPFDPVLVGIRIWGDPSDLSTMWQDAARTQPANENGVLVASLANKGSLGGFWTQSTESLRPTLRIESGLRWLEWTGTGGFMLASFSNTSQPYDRISAFRTLAGNSSPRLLGEGASQLSVVFPNVLQMEHGASFNTGIPFPDVDVDFVVTERLGATDQLAIDAGAFVSGNAGNNALSSFSIAGLIGQPGTFYRCRFVGTMAFPTLSAANLLGAQTELAIKQGRVI